MKLVIPLFSVALLCALPAAEPPESEPIAVLQSAATTKQPTVHLDIEVPELVNIPAELLVHVFSEDSDLAKSFRIPVVIRIKEISLVGSTAPKIVVDSATLKLLEEIFGKRQGEPDTSPSQ